MNFDARLDALALKPPSHITQEDARQIQSAEVRYINANTAAATRNTPLGDDDESATLTVLGNLLPE